MPRASRGGSNEKQSTGHNHGPLKAEKAKKRYEESRFGQHRAAISGIAASPGADIAGGIVTKHSVSALRQKLARSVYVPAIAMATVGWMWMLFAGLEWVLGA
jgi:hypothetical protein